MTTAKCLAASVSDSGEFLYTFQFTMPRFELASFNKHGLIRSSTASSRAIPVAKRADAVLENFWTPKRVGKNKNGMQAADYLEAAEFACFSQEWRNHVAECVAFGKRLSDMSVHKEIANRVFENFSYVTVIGTTSNLSNLFRQRIHPDAQDDFAETAIEIFEAVSKMRPVKTKVHIPYSTREELDYVSQVYEELNPEQFENILKSTIDSRGDDKTTNILLKAVGRAASVSYEKQDVEKTDEGHINVAYKLLTSKPGHWAPLEHVAFDVTGRLGEKSGYGCKSWKPLRGFIENRMRRPDEWDWAQTTGNWEVCRELVENVKNSMKRGCHG